MNIIFDFGVVLFKWDAVEVVQQVFSESATDGALTRAAALELKNSLFGEHFEVPDWNAFDAGTIHPAPLIDAMAARTGLPRAKIAQLVAIIPDALAPNLSMVALLDELRAQGHALYYLSNMPAPYARILQERHAFVRAFLGGVFSGDVHCTKPDPNIYALLCKTCSLRPAESLFIDDHPPNVTAATAYGMQALHYRHAEQAIAELRALLAD